MDLEADPRTGEPAFAARYGPWALVLGASDGVGAAYARAMADRGLNVVLVARRRERLDRLAAEIRAATGVEARAAAVDLAAPDAMERLAAAAEGLEVGMVMYCAGADPNYEPFLANPIEVAEALVRRNCVVPMRVCHHFAAPMAARGRGGIVLVSSGAGLYGGANAVAYGASKAFDLVMAESLWAELHDQGVDVLALVLGATDTPALRRLLVRRGALPDEATPVPGAVPAGQVVEEALANLADGPTWFVGEQLRQGTARLAAMPRGDAVRAILRSTGGTMGTRRQAAR